MTVLVQQHAKARRRRKQAQARESKKTFRPDIEGLRAIAVLFVLIWHAGVPWLPGGFVGVDVFFVVSGFLMTSILHREQRSSRTGRIDVAAFYARRARRLIPASTLTLLTTALAAFLVLPETRWRDIGFDIAAAGTYWVNWLLADRAVDYLSQGSAPSPLQHFWSLSVEEQFYIFWPLLIAAIGWIIVKARGPITVSIFITLSIVAAGSLAWSIYLTATDAGRAYFVSTTRLWELALGGLVALAMPSCAKLPRAAAAALAWAGVAGIVGTGILLTTEVPFPGSVALIPTVSTALVIAAGPAAGNAGPVVIFANTPTQWIGGCSYSIYLWHWPVLVIGGYWITDGLRDITVIEGVVLVTLSVLPAWLSLRYVETPFRDSEDLKASVSKSLSLALIGIATAVIAGLLLVIAGPKPAVAYVSQYVPPPGVEVEPVGAEVLGSDPLASPLGRAVDFVKSITPDPSAAPNDNPRIYADGCHLEFEEETPRFCEYGDLESTTEVAVIGDSHAAQWLPALQAVAVERGWKLKVSTKSSCPFLDVPLRNNTERPYDECVVWNQKVAEYLTGPEKPAAVVLSYGNYPVRTREIVPAAIKQLTPIAAQGTEFVIIRDTPIYRLNLPECVAGHRNNLSACATPREEALAGRDQSQPAVAPGIPGAKLVDLTDWICPSDMCPAVVGGAIVYRDEQHLTATYSRSLARQLNTAIGALTP